MPDAEGAGAGGSLHCDAGFMLPAWKWSELVTVVKSERESAPGWCSGLALLPTRLLTVCPRLALLQGSGGSASGELILSETDEFRALRCFLVCELHLQASSMF